MSDDLIKRLRFIEWSDAPSEAADRIEQLERQLDTMQDCLDTANKAWADAMSLAATKQAKLAEAIEALNTAIDYLERGNDKMAYSIIRKVCWLNWRPKNE